LLAILLALVLLGYKTVRITEANHTALLRYDPEG